MSDLLQSPETYPNMEIEWTQVDILRNGAADDLLDDDRRQGILEDIRSGKYHFVAPGQFGQDSTLWVFHGCQGRTR